MGVSINTDFNDRTKLSDWYKIVKRNFLTLKDYIEGVDKKGHSHQNKSLLDGLSEVRMQNWDNAAGGGMVVKPKSIVKGMFADLLATEFDKASAHTENTSNPHKTTAAQLGLGKVTNESKTEMFDSPTFTGVPTAPTAPAGTSTQQLATTEFVNMASESSVVFGVYKGNGASERFINLGFTPMAVFLYDERGQVYDDGHVNTYRSGGLTVRGNPLNGVLEITDNGFKVFYRDLGSGDYIRTNYSDRHYHFAAFKFGNIIDLTEG